MKIGDKPSSFLDSKEWIGCNEVGFVLNEWFQMDYKMATVFEGQYQGLWETLSRHFAENKGPVMVGMFCDYSKETGGGQMAFTVLGVALVEKELRLLLLDPRLIFYN